VNPASAGNEAERRLAELQAALEARDPDPRALELAGERVAAALSRLTRATPPAELARVLDLHACVRETAARRHSDADFGLRRVRAERARLSHLTRPSDGETSLDVDA